MWMDESWPLLYLVLYRCSSPVKLRNKRIRETSHPAGEKQPLIRDALPSRHLCFYPHRPAVLGSVLCLSSVINSASCSRQWTPISLKWLEKILSMIQHLLISLLQEVHRVFLLLRWNLSCLFSTQLNKLHNNMTLASGGGGGDWIVSGWRGWQLFIKQSGVIF